MIPISRSGIDDQVPISFFNNLNNGIKHVINIHIYEKRLFTNPILEFFNIKKFLLKEITFIFFSFNSVFKLDHSPDAFKITPS